MNKPIGMFESDNGARYREPSDAKHFARDAYEETYDEYFHVVPAKTAEQREQSFRLRYQVYCIENAFEPAARNRDGQETDEYDGQSVHSLLLQRSSEVAVGTVRLILPRLDDFAAPLPIERVCSAPTMARYAECIPSERTAEISRFAIARKYRQRRAGKSGAQETVGLVGDGESWTKIPYICLGLMRAIVAMARETEMTHLYAVMEPTLLRLLRRLGVYFEALGPLVDYHGRRQPCFCDLDELLATTYRKRPDVWAILTDYGRLWPLKQEQWHGSDALSAFRKNPLWLAGGRGYPPEANTQASRRIKGTS